MESITFPAEVCGGQIRHQSLGPLEGRKVEVTVNVPAPAPTAEGAGLEPADWLEVEDDTLFDLPRRITMIPAVKIIDAGRMKPTGILPEGLGDDE